MGVPLTKIFREIKWNNETRQYDESLDDGLRFILTESLKEKLDGGEIWIHLREVKHDGDTIEYLPNQGYSGWYLKDNLLLVGEFHITRTIHP